MSVMTSFTLRALKKNRVRTVVSIIGIALSCALFTAVFTSVTSLYGGLLERVLSTEGSWQVYSPSYSEAALDALEQSENVVDLAVFRELGSAYMTEQDSLTLGKIATVRTLPETVKGTFSPEDIPLTILPEIKEGRMPESSSEIILPDFCKGEILGNNSPDASVVTDDVLEVGSTLTLDLGMRVVDNRDGSGRLVLNSVVYDYLSPDGGSYPHQEEIIDASVRSYKVVGFYARQTSGFMGNNFTSASSATSIVGITSAGAPGEGIAGAHLTVQGLSSFKAILEFLDEVVDDDGFYPSYHQNLLTYQGVDDGRPITGTVWMIAYVLAFVIVVASASLIYNSFAISVADRTRQFGLLSFIGASKKQLRRSVLFEALFLGIIGIPIGVIVGLAGVSAVFALTQDAFSALLGTGGEVVVCVEPGTLAVAVLLSFLVLLVSAWIPSRRAGRVSAVDAIRQTQEVKVSKRSARKTRSLAKKATKQGHEVSVGISGLAGKLFGVPGFIAHRNLSRSSARGRSVVVSLAVSVVLIVIAGSISLYFMPLSDRAESKDGAGSGADIIVSGAPSRDADLGSVSNALVDFCGQAEAIEGVEHVSSSRQGQATGVIPAAMISDDGRIVGDSFDSRQINSAWASSSFVSNGDYVGEIVIFYIDNASWMDIVREAGLEESAYTDPSNPRAVALDRYQGSTDGDRYFDAHPFAQTGTVDLYAVDHGDISDDSHSLTPIGLREGSNGELAFGYVDQYKDESQNVIEKPLEEVSTKMTLEVGALVDQVPPSISASSASTHFPVLILPESVAASEAGAVSPSGDTGVFDYSWVNISFKAENHVEAAEALGEMTSLSELMGFGVSDIAESARENRLIAQAVQLFIFCFSVIMLLIAVANVFNTLTNSIILRTREFAMLKSAGMGDRAFARMLIYECASYALRGLAIGLVIAVAVTYLFYRAINLSFVGIAFDLPWAYVGVAVVVVLAILALSVIFALRKSHASSVVDALRADVV